MQYNTIPKTLLRPVSIMFSAGLLYTKPKYKQLLMCSCIRSYHGVGTLTGLNTILLPMYTAFVMTSAEYGIPLEPTVKTGVQLEKA